MDSTQTSQATPVQQNTGLPQPAQSSQQVPTVAPAGGRKESLPVAPTEWVSQSAPEKVVLPKDVEQAGVEVHTTTPTLPPSAQQAGVTHAKEATPVTPVAVEPLGMKTPQSILSQLKAAHTSWKDGFSWLVRLIIKEQEKEKKGPLV